jgi:hypothetical protein
MSDKIVGVGIPAIKNKELGKIFDETFNFATNPVGAGDTFSCLLPINSELSEVYYQIGTASTDASADFSAGITGSLTAYASAVSLTPAGVLVKCSGPPTLITGATTYLVITFPYALTTGSLRVVVYGRLIG